MAEKNYIKGVWIKPGKFGKRISIHRENFIKSLMTCEANDKGYINIDLLAMKQPDDKGNTDYMVENTWKPDSQASQANGGSRAFDDIPQAKSTANEDDFQDLPF